MSNKASPAIRRLKRQRIDSEKACVQRWKDTLERLTPGMLPHRKATEELERAKARLADLKGEI